MKQLVHLIFELFHLKEVKHEGYRLVGVPHPSSVAEHSLNAAQIGTILAIMEGVDPAKVTTMLVWHDTAETRIGDLHKIAVRYITNKKDIEKKVTKEQLSDKRLSYIKSLLDDMYEKSSDAAKVAKDADYLEMAFQAKIYVEQGYEDAQDRIKNVGNHLKTKSAKALWKEMTSSKSTDWRKETNLKKLPK